ncbi:MAG TPA: helix-hairpin-helix domain-containing protein, partial [Rhodothermales bacterium]|nr:helix-hairpin-helix domain-containing protein [Rhodothermales bacterium]
MRAAGLLTMLLALMVRLAVAQERDSSDVEAVLETLEDAVQGEALAERIAELRARPLDLNTAGADALAELPGVSLLLAERIVRYRETHGGFRSLPELLQVTGVSEALYGALRPFLTLGTTTEPTRRRVSPYPAVPSWQTLRQELRLDLAQRYARRLDSLEDGFLGDPARLLTRVRLTSRDRLAAVLVLDKDPGERFIWRPDQGSYGYDFVSAGLALRRWGRFDALVLGDFVASFGQGLVLGRTGAMGKGREATRGVARTGPGLTLHGSSEENRFYRGAGASVQVYPGLSLTAFGSMRTLDASPADDSLTVSSLGTSGLHRTDAELARKDYLHERAWGSALRFRRGPVDAGVLYAGATFKPPLYPGDAPFDRYDLRGTNYSAVSAFGRLLMGPALAFGEAARSHNGALAATGGVLLGLAQAGELVVAGRHYDRAFQAPHGEAFGQRGGPAVNERGVYVGARLRPSRTVTATAYIDSYRFPYLRFNTYRPTEGFDVLISLEHRPRRWLTYHLLVRHERKEESLRTLDALGRDVRTVAPQARAAMRLHGEYVFSRRLTLRSRVEGVRFTPQQGDAEFGVLLYQDVHLVPVRGLALELR